MVAPVIHICSRRSNFVSSIVESAICFSIVKIFILLYVLKFHRIKMMLGLNALVK